MATIPIPRRPDLTPVQFRRLVADQPVALLAPCEPQTALVPAARLAALDGRVNNHLVANVRQTDGAARVEFEERSGEYFLKRQR